MPSGSSSPLRVYVAVAEASGDQLACSLVQRLRARYPHATFRGLTGPKLRQAGVTTIADAAQLHAFGLVEVLPKVPALWSLRRRLQADLSSWRPDVLVTVDSPDFMLGLARHARTLGIPTLHWVSPQVWAWRPGRVNAIARSVDTICCLLPFEPAWFRDAPVRAVFTGHPAAIRTPSPVSTVPRIMLAPGSRPSEWRRLWPYYRRVAQMVAQRMPEVTFSIACAPGVGEPELGGLAADYRRGLHAALEGSSVALVASGTATLEVAAAGVAQVVAYRVARSTHAIGRRLVRLSHVALPNILAGRAVIPEHLQHLDAPTIADQLVALHGQAGRQQTETVARVLAQLHAEGAIERVADELALLVD